MWDIASAFLQLSLIFPVFMPAAGHHQALTFHYSVHTRGNDAWADAANTLFFLPVLKVHLAASSVRLEQDAVALGETLFVSVGLRD